MTSASGRGAAELQPGRRPVPSRFVLGETAAESWERIEGALRAEFGRRPNPASVGPDSETAQQRFSRFLRTDFAPRIRDLGFKGSGNQFRVARGNYSGWF